MGFHDFEKLINHSLMEKTFPTENLNDYDFQIWKGWKSGSVIKKSDLTFRKQVFFVVFDLLFRISEKDNNPNFFYTETYCIITDLMI